FVSNAAVYSFLRTLCKRFDRCLVLRPTRVFWRRRHIPLVPSRPQTRIQVSGDPYRSRHRDHVPTIRPRRELLNTRRTPLASQQHDQQNIHTDTPHTLLRSPDRESRYRRHDDNERVRPATGDRTTSVSRDEQRTDRGTVPRWGGASRPLRIPARNSSRTVAAEGSHEQHRPCSLLHSLRRPL